MKEVRNLETGLCDLAPFHASIPGHEPPAAFSRPILLNRGDIFIRRGTDGLASLADLRAATGCIVTPPQGRDFLLAEGCPPSSTSSPPHSPKR